MAKSLEDQLRDLLGDPAAVAGLGDIAQAAALARQQNSFRQRAGAAASRLRRARVDGAPPGEIAALEARVKARTDRLDVARHQAETADIARPLPDKALAQVMGRTQGTVENLPLTAAILSAENEPLSSAGVDARGLFHLTHEGDLDQVRVQVSDAKSRVLFRSLDPFDVDAGAVLYVDVPLTPPKPEPGTVPREVKMPELVGQSEAYAVALLARLGREDAKISDKKGDGIPDIVIDQSPEAGAKLTKDSKIALTVRRAKSGDSAPNTLPELVGMEAAKAEERLKGLGLKSKRDNRAHDGAAGIVLEQRPEAGTTLEGLKTVTLVVSEDTRAEPLPATVPDLTGKSRADALEILRALNLKGKVEDSAKADQREGVVAQTPRAGTLVEIGSTVVLTVNSKPAVEAPRVAVPGVVGLSQAETTRLLKGVELKVMTRSVTADAPKGQVMAQDPEADARAEPGSTVTLKISSGPREVTTGPRNLSALAHAMAKEERARQARLGAGDIEATLKRGGVTTIAAARTLAEMPVAEVQATLRLGTARAASTFRIVLRDALEAAD